MLVEPPHRRAAWPRLFRSGCAAIAAVIMLIACQPGGADVRNSHTGHFSYGFETVSFQPCGSDEAWWVNGEVQAMQTLLDRYAELAGASYEPVYVELSGDVSAPGSYGHLGAYQREFAVTEVVEVRAAAEEDCS